ncbi:hypothetical protein HA402_000661 [Bradysia odoriphaga]|nr:hypothetical protein HA402_000661 [Bradysia odoriphaga]
MARPQYIAALDVGTTSIRCFIYNDSVITIGSATEQVHLLYPKPGFVEIDPDQLWNSIIKTIEDAVKDAKLEMSDIICLGISTQRSTFITWDRQTGQTFHNFITWKDIRADKLVKKWNSSCIIKTMHGVSRFLYLMTRSNRFLAGSVLKLMNTQTTLRLHWVIKNNERLNEAIRNKTAMFGTLDSWLLYRLRKGYAQNKYVEHISDITSCSATGFYDPFSLNWADWALKLFSINKDMLPRVVDNSYDFGYVDKSILGHEIKIGCMIGDQSASMWGSCCFNRGDVKVTLGTGSFLNVNTGQKCHASVHGLYPLVAWRWRKKEQKSDELMYCVEGASNDTGSIIKWAQDFGLFTDPAESSDIANTVDNTDGVYFVPAFSGLGAPVNDYQAASGLIGLRPSTNNAHIVRAVLESIAFRVAQLYTCTLNETDFTFSVIRVDGGVSRNDFVCQLLADLTRLHVERSDNPELSVLGAGFLAGLNVGVWKDRNDLLRLRKVEKVFVPRPEIYSKCLESFRAWEKACNRFKGWYNEIK